MIRNTKTQQLLRQICQNSGVKWVVWVTREKDNWIFTNCIGGTKAILQAINRFTDQPEIATWLAGSLSSGTIRLRTTVENANPLNCHKVYLFPVPNQKKVIMVGSDLLAKSTKDIFSLISQLNLQLDGPQQPENLIKGSNTKLEGNQLVSARMDVDQPDGWVAQSSVWIDQFLKQLPESYSINQLIDYTILTLQELVQGEQITIYLLSRDRKSLIAYKLDKHPKGESVASVVESLPGSILQQKKIARYDDLTQAPYAYQSAQFFGSGLYAPMIFQNEPIGVISFENRQNKSFTSLDEEKLKAVSYSLGIIFVNSIIRQQTKQISDLLKLIHTIVLRVLKFGNETEIAQETASLLAEYMQCELVMVLLADETNNYLVSTGVGGEKNYLVVPGFQIPTSVGLTGKAFRDGEVVIYNDLEGSEEYFNYPGWKAGSAVCVPLRDRERILGIINVEAGEKNFFSDHDVKTLESISGILTSVLINLRRYRELKQHIEAQQLAESRLVRSARLAAVGEMAAGVAHELNNPLTTVIGFLELVLQDLPETIDSRQDLDLALREAQRAREVVRRLLDFSRQSGNILIRADINTLIGEVVPLVQHQFQTSRVELILDLAGGLPYININPSQIKQVILNLLQNALQAMSDGGVVHVKSGLEARGEGMGVYIKVKDSGEGIAPENYERIFEPFFTTRPVGKGTGLGLSVSYGIVTSHGGHIDVESVIGRGSTFTVWLPLENRA
jgi:signal transduction histidine kinase